MYSKSKIIFQQKVTDEDGHLIEIVVWGVPVGIKQPDGVRYRLAFIPRSANFEQILRMKF